MGAISEDEFEDTIKIGKLEQRRAETGGRHLTRGATTWRLQA